ncbi:MAG: prepilin-type N-terminal cleavage/methylation domain-containing protein [Planctomycetes bacterium]|nr:prepilin-type N-terminal cleavage/methylation domain-containing protein [Planctomycetota bacterium]
MTGIAEPCRPPRCGDEGAPRPRGGYTLLELLVVLAILAIFAGLAAPRFADFLPGYRLDQAAVRVMTLARKARTDAATQRLRTRLTCAVGANTYGITVEADPLRAAGVYVPPANGWGQSFPLPDGVRFAEVDLADGTVVTAGSGTIRFHPDGTADEAIVMLEDVAGHQRFVYVRGLTGRVSILPVDEEGLVAPTLQGAGDPSLQRGALEGGLGGQGGVIGK